MFIRYTFWNLAHWPIKFKAFFVDLVCIDEIITEHRVLYLPMRFYLGGIFFNVFILASWLTNYCQRIVVLFIKNFGLFCCNDLNWSQIVFDDFPLFFKPNNDFLIKRFRVTLNLNNFKPLSHKISMFARWNHFNDRRTISLCWF